jgi:hypothetical protein
MDLPRMFWNLLLWGALPLWLLAGAADWWCHRRTGIACTSGPRESLLHLLLFVEIALPLGLALWFETTAAMLVFLAAGVAAHMLTSWWDTTLAQPRRYIAPIEQMVHSWLEMLPLFALVVVAVLSADEFAEPRWWFEVREPALDAGLRAGILLGLAAGIGMVLEELSRGLRAARVTASEASAPAVAPRP